jgi:hypothetical protein
MRDEGVQALDIARRFFCRSARRMEIFLLMRLVRLTLRFLTVVE